MGRKPFENASDYDEKLAKMDTHHKTIVEMLLELGGVAKKIVGVKRMRPENRKSSIVTKDIQPAAPVFTRKENALIEQKIEILKWHHKTKSSQSNTARHWDKIYPNLTLKHYTISPWLVQEKEIQEEYQKLMERGQSTKTKRVKQVEHPEANEMLELWVAKAMMDNVLLSSEILRQQWSRFADLLQIPEDERLKLSDGWLEGFKNRCGLKGYKQHGEAGSAKPEDVEDEHEWLRELIRELVQKHENRLKSEDDGGAIRLHRDASSARRLGDRLRCPAEKR
ncbi:hypothetical protein H0H87_008786, partial [Tephrocybe sp. NHM501043]